jgi:eukaryotic-like serine/threonine-protein kinase
MASPGSPPAPTTRVLKQRYRLVGHLGKGGMGTVHQAEDLHVNGRQVAIKELCADGQTAQEIAEATTAFQQEAAILAGLSHPSLPTIYDHFYEDGRWYLVMALIAGQTLEDRLQHTGGQGLPVAEVVRIGQQLCAVLEYLHAHRPPVIFRDLKPANIMLAPDGHLYLIDFGIARFFKPGQPHDTVALGTSGYAPPEQYARAQTQTNPRADLFALGATLHYALTGLDPSQHPFQFAPVRACCPLAPPALERLITRLVQTDASQRPAGATEVHVALDRIAAVLPASAPAEYAAHTAPTAPRVAPALSPTAGAFQPGPGPWPPAPRSAARPNGAPYAPMRRTSPPISRPAAWLDIPGLLLAGLLMVGIFGGCVWGTVWLNHAVRAMVSAPDVVARPPVSASSSLGATLYTYRGHSNTVVAVAWSPDGQRLASGSWDGTVQVWDAFTGDHAVVYRGQGAAVNAIAWSPDGTRIASAGGDGRVHVWDTATGSDLVTYSGHAASVTSVAWSPDGARIASGSWDGTVQVWDPDSGRTLLVYQGHTGNVNAVAWSPDGARVVSASSDGTAQVWDATTGAHLVTFSGHTNIVWTVAWSPDGARIASGSWDGTVQVWDAASGEPIATADRHSGPVLAVAWSPSGQRLAFAGADAQRVQLWAVGAPSIASLSPSHLGSIQAIAWSPDGSAIASAGSDRTVQVLRGR